MAAEYLMRAKTLNPAKDKIGGFFISEKLDGMRAFWDGGVSRGDPTISVPWANVTDPKTGLPKKKILPVSTGLWSRYGNPIMAPDWWLNQLPCCPLDGELWAGRGNFQACRSTVSRDNPDERWRGIQFIVFGCPSPANVFARREIKGPNLKMTVNPGVIYGYVQNRLDSGLLEDYQALPSNSTFTDELQFLRTALGEGVATLHSHVLLPEDNQQALDAMQRFMDGVYAEGGEGIVLRRPRSIWLPCTTRDQLKLKPVLDDRATVTGFISGRETDKGSKLRGLIGALVVDFRGIRLELSGLTDEMRKFSTIPEEKFAHEHPGVEMPPHFEGRYFKAGDEIEFRYRELSDTGVPKEARFLRKV